MGPLCALRVAVRGLAPRVHGVVAANPRWAQSEAAEGEADGSKPPPSQFVAATLGVSVPRSSSLPLASALRAVGSGVGHWHIPLKSTWPHYVDVLAAR
jgi:hypothetical protein